jgi:prolyl-tRNA synthetase
MRLSTLFGRTLREAPAEADNRAYQLVLRAGLARPLQAGSFVLLPLGMRALRRIEAIIHEEMASIGGQELRVPVVQPVEPWQRSGRYEVYGPAMIRLADRTERALIMAPTNEEAVADLARREVNSYRQLPALVYQVQTKYRDELRARGGMLRMREFTMLDVYSLDAAEAGLDQSYALLRAAFERIFRRCGVTVLPVQASNGEMGGSESVEYIALSASGEDTLVLCHACGYAANSEVAMSGHQNQEPRTKNPSSQGSGFSVLGSRTEEVATPDCKTIAELAAFLGVPAAATAKAVFFDTPERGLVFAVIRGDLEVSEAKLAAAAGVSRLAPASAEQIAAAGAVPGYASPVGLAIASSAVFVVADPSVVAAGPLVAGANRAGYHLRNVVYDRDWRASIVADIAAVHAGDPCVRCGAPLALERGVELGHIFKLGTHYAHILGATFLDEDGSTQPIVMGSYGIGLERLLQAIVEQHHDDAGIVWPPAVAPFDIHLLQLGKSDTTRAAAETLLAELETAGLRVLYDDRNESAGIKFNDADLIGLPVRLLVSDRLLAEGMVELKPRGGSAEKVARADVAAWLRRDG